jgi:hypothetical protein
VDARELKALRKERRKQRRGRHNQPVATPVEASTGSEMEVDHSADEVLPAQS